MFFLNIKHMCLRKYSGSSRIISTRYDWIKLDHRIVGRLDSDLRGKFFEEHRECDERGRKFCKILSMDRPK